MIRVRLRETERISNLVCSANLSWHIVIDLLEGQRGIGEFFLWTSVNCVVLISSNFSFTVLAGVCVLAAHNKKGYETCRHGTCSCTVHLVREKALCLTNYYNLLASNLHKGSVHFLCRSKGSGLCRQERPLHFSFGERKRALPWDCSL